MSIAETRAAVPSEKSPLSPAVGHLLHEVMELQKLPPDVFTKKFVLEHGVEVALMNNVSVITRAAIDPSFQFLLWSGAGHDLFPTLWENNDPRDGKGYHIDGPNKVRLTEISAWKHTPMTTMRALHGLVAPFIPDSVPFESPSRSGLGISHQFELRLSPSIRLIIDTSERLTKHEKLKTVAGFDALTLPGGSYQLLLKIDDHDGAFRRQKDAILKTREEHSIARIFRPKHIAKFIDMQDPNATSVSILDGKITVTKLTIDDVLRIAQENQFTVHDYAYKDQQYYVLVSDSDEATIILSSNVGEEHTFAVHIIPTPSYQEKRHAAMIQGIKKELRMQLRDASEVKPMILDIRNMYEQYRLVPRKPFIRSVQVHEVAYPQEMVDTILAYHLIPPKQLFRVLHAMLINPKSQTTQMTHLSIMELDGYRYTLHWYVQMDTKQKPQVCCWASKAEKIRQQM